MFTGTAVPRSIVSACPSYVLKEEPQTCWFVYSFLLQKLRTVLGLAIEDGSLEAFASLCRIVACHFRQTTHLHSILRMQ